MLMRPMREMYKPPAALPLVPTNVVSNPELNVPTANAEGTTLLIIDASKDSHASILLAKDKQASSNVSTRPNRQQLISIVRSVR